MITTRNQVAKTAVLRRAGVSSPGWLAAPRGSGRDRAAMAETSTRALSRVPGTGLRAASANSTVPLRLWISILGGWGSNSTHVRAHTHTQPVRTFQVPVSAREDRSGSRNETVTSWRPADQFQMVVREGRLELRPGGEGAPDGRPEGGHSRQRGERRP